MKLSSVTSAPRISLASSLFFAFLRASGRAPIQVSFLLGVKSSKKTEHLNALLEIEKLSKIYKPVVLGDLLFSFLHLIHKVRAVPLFV